MLIRTVTTRYDPLHDRLSMDVRGDSGVTARLWLTRRLLARLVPNLVAAVQKQIRAPEEVAPKALDAANVYAQLQSRITRRPADAVEWAPGSREGLVSEIQLRVESAGTCRIAFSCADGLACELPMTATEQRQWLEAVCRCCEQGEWALGVWPAWLRSSARAPAGAAPTGG